MRSFWTLCVSLLAISSLAFLGCDDDDATTGGDVTVDAGAGGGGGTVVPEGPDTYKFVQIDFTKPEGGIGTILSRLLLLNMNKGTIIIMVRTQNGEGDALTLWGGAAQQINGVDTVDDVSDDSFGWLTEGTCLTEDGEAPCEVDVGEGAGHWTDGEFSVGPLQLDIYSWDMKVIFRIKNLTMTGHRDGDEVLIGTLDGVMTSADAAIARFAMAPGQDPLPLKQIMDDANVTEEQVDDGTGNMVPGYIFAGSYEAEQTTFSED